jgi:signal peptidase II
MSSGACRASAPAGCDGLTATSEGRGRYVTERPAPGPTEPDVRAAGRMRVTANPVFWCAAVLALGVGADVATKSWALARLSHDRDITLPGGLIRLQLVINHGAAFGLGASYEPILTAAAFIGVILLSAWAVRATGRVEGLGAALAAAGAAGNLIDRLTRPPAVLHGGVVDWLHVSFYGPTFNLADVWLRAGALIAVWAWLWQHRMRAAQHPAPRELDRPLAT